MAEYVIHQMRNISTLQDLSLSCSVHFTMASFTRLCGPPFSFVAPSSFTFYHAFENGFDQKATFLRVSELLQFAFTEFIPPYNHNLFFLVQDSFNKTMFCESSTSGCFFLSLAFISKTT